MQQLHRAQHGAVTAEADGEVGRRRVGLGGEVGEIERGRITWREPHPVTGGVQRVGRGTGQRARLSAFVMGDQQHRAHSLHPGR